MSTRLKLQNEIFDSCRHLEVLSNDICSLPDFCNNYIFMNLFEKYHEVLFSSDSSPSFETTKGNNIPPDIQEQFLAELKDLQSNMNGSEFDTKAYRRLMNIGLDLGVLRYASNQKKEKEIEYLSESITSWEKTIKNEKHSDQKLKWISEDTRKQIRELKNNFKKNGTPEVLLKKEIQLTLYKTKYNYIKSLFIVEEIEKTDDFPLELKLNESTIYFTHQSLIHILNRHFGAVISNNLYKRQKSYFKKVFNLEKVHIILKKIFFSLNKSDFLKQDSLKINYPYNIKFKGTIYQFYLKKFGDKKQKVMISSFYPLEDKQEIIKLKKLCHETAGNDVIIYKPCN